MNLFRKKPSTTDVSAAPASPAAAVDLNTESSSLEGSPAVTTGAITPQETVSPALIRAELSRRRRRTIRYSVLVLLLVCGGVAFVARWHQPTKQPLANSVTQRYGTVSIPLANINSGSLGGASAGGIVSVNGQLNVNNALVLAPIKQPGTAIAGQLYYDQATNQLAFYNGKTFDALAAGSKVVSSLGGNTGDITLGNGLGFVNNQLSYTGNTGVLSLQGETGDVSLTAGGGIAIDGTTVSSTGVLALGGQNGSIAVGAGLSAAGGTLKNNGVISAMAGSGISVINDGSGNITISNTGSGGNVSTGGGSAGKLAVFTGVQTIADSLISESGSVVTVAGDLTVTGNLNLSSPLSVLQGGTGSATALGARGNLGAAASGANSDITSLSGLTTALSVSQGGSGVGTLSTNGVLIGNGTSPITAVNGSAGQCLIATAGAPVFQACPGGSGGVTSLDGLNGSLTLANSSAAGSTVTINDASAAAKGIASFNATNFLVSAGAVNTAQDIAVSSTPTFAGLNLGSPLTVGNGGTGSTNAAGARSNLGAASNGANSDITSLSGLTTALSVVQGGTGAGSLTANGILLGNGTGAITVVAAGSSGLCLVSTAGAPVWQACPGSGGVTSVNGLSGVLSIANASGSGATITINNAQANGTTKGLATFSSANFIDNGSGLIDTIQGIATTSTPTFAGLNLGAALSLGNGGTGSTTAAGARANLGAAGSGANSDITSLSGLTTALSVGQGGTGAITLATNGVIVGQGSSALTSVTAGGAGLCLVSTLGAPIFATCPGSGGVVSVNGLTGVLNISNASAAGSTITLNDAKADGSTKGIAAFNSINFSDNGLGVINTVQDIDSAATPTFGGLNLGSPLTVANGGTGAATALGARSNLGAAASGANSDITSLSGLLTALSVAQGGTGTNSLTSHGVLVGNGTSPVSTANGTSGQVLIANGLNVPTFTTIGGDITIDSSGNTTIGAGKVTNSKLANSSLTVSAGTGLAGGGSAVLGGSVSLNVQYGAVAGTAVQGSVTLVCPGGSGNLSGGGDTITLGAGGTCSNISITNSPVFSGTLAVQGSGGITVGTVAVPGVVSLTNGTNSNLSILQAGVLSGTGDTTFTLPAVAGGSAQTICTVESGNCAGSGGGLTGAGSSGQLAVFTGSGSLGNSSLSDSGSTLTYTGNAVIQGSNSLTLGTGSGATGAIIFKNATNNNALTLQTGVVGSSFTLTLPTTVGNNGDCLESNGLGVLSFSSCTGGAGGGVTSLNGLAGVLTLSNASGVGSTITINNAKADGATKGIAAFNGTNFSDNGSGVINTVQNINSGATPTFAGLNLGSPLTVGNGGTGAATASGARANLSAAASGANSDITSLSGLTTALSVSQGGTGLNALTANQLLFASSSSAVAQLANGTAGQCLVSNGTSLAPSFQTCTGAGGVSSLDGLNGSITLANSSGAGGTITIDSAKANGLTQGIAAFTAANFTDNGSGLIDTIQGIATTSSPQFANVTLTTALHANSIIPNSALSVGATSQNLTLQGATVSLNSTAAGITNSLTFATPSGVNKTIILPNASGTVAVSASGYINLNAATGNITFVGPLAVADGGTGAATAAGARTSLSAAASGANSDITSLSGLTTALSVGQGGTGLQSLTGFQLLYAASSSSISQLSNGASGNCLVSNGAGAAASFQACPGAGGVTSVDGLSGGLTISNTTGAGATITINSAKADGTTKGIAAFNSTNFSDNGSGVINTVQNINSTATPTFGALTLSNANSLALGTASTNTGSLLFRSSAGAGSITLTPANPGASAFSITLPAASGTVCLDSGNCLGGASGSANTALSNLVTTSINQSLVANASNTLDLGSASTAWRTGYFGTQVQTALVDSMSGALALGTNNATIININQSATLAAGKSIAITGGITSSRPSSPTEGMLYYDTTTKSLLVYANGKWQADRSTATRIVGTSASGGTSSAVASQNPDAADYVNTSTTSAQTTIQSAISSLPATGGTVYLMEGIYIVDGNVTLPSNVNLVGSGANTILKIKNSTNANLDLIKATSTIDHITISNLKIDGNSSNQTSGTMNGLNFTTFGNSLGGGSQVSNLWLENLRNTGITLGSAYNTTITNIMAANLNTVLSIGGGQGNTIAQVTGYNATNGLLINGGTYNSITAISLYSSGSGTAVQVGSSSSSLSNFATNNFYNYAVLVSGSDNTVTGGEVNQSGIRITGSHNTVNGNTMSLSSTEGIYIASGATDNTISGNTIDSMNAGVCTTGSITIIDSSRNLVNGNTISNSGGHGIYLARSSGTIDSNTVSNNTIYNSGTATGCGGGSDSGITINGGGAVTNTRIIHNTITDTAGTGYAINITGSSASGTYLSSNIYAGTGASSINDAGAGTIYVNQADGNGNLINKTQGGGFTVGTGTAVATFSLQGGLVTSQLSAPTAGSVTNIGTAGSTTYRYQITALDGSGETTGSSIVQTTTGNATLSTTNYNTVTWSAVSGAYKYNIYRCTGAACTPQLLTNVVGNVTSYNDQAAGSPSGNAPGSNTTGGAAFAGALQAPSLDTVSSATLSLGTVNANAISIGKSGITTTITGSLVQQTGTVSLTGNGASSLSTTSGLLTLQGAGGVSLSTTNTTASSSITFQSGNSSAGTAGTVTIDTGTSSSGTSTLNLGSTNAGTINIGNASTSLTNIGGTLFTVDATNAKVSVGTPGTALSNARFGVTAINSFTALGVNQTGSGKLLDIQNNGTSVITADNNGNVTIKPNATNTSAFNVQQGISWFNLDTSNGFVINNGTTSPDNLLQNPGFESNAAFEASGWSLTSNGTIQVDAANAHSGSKVLELAATGAGYTIPSAKYYAVTPGETYYIEGWTKAAAGTNGSANLNLTFYDANKANGTSTSVSANSSTTYTQVSGTATVPAGKYFMRVAPAINASSTTGTWYFDDLYVARASQQQPLVIHPAADSTNLFQVQNTATTSIFNVDTTGSGAVTVGNTLSVGSTVNAVSGYKFNGTAGSTTTCTSGNILQNAVIQGGIVTGGSCVANGGGSGVTTVGLLNGASASSNGATITGTTIYLQSATATAPGLIDTGSQIFAGSKTFSNDVTVGTSLTTPLIQSSSDLSIQANGTGNLLLDTTGAGTISVAGSNASTVNIANNAAAHTVSIAAGAAQQTVVIGSTNGASATTIQGGSGNITLLTTTGNIILGSTGSGNYVTFSASGGLQAFGNAQHTKTILLTPEYPGAVLDASNDANCVLNTTNNGTMTSGYDNSSSRMNYYNWMSTQTSNQCYDVVVQVPIPSDFNGWASAPSIQLKASDTSNTSYGIAIVDSSNTFDANYTSSYAAPGTLGTSWANMSTSSLSGTYTAGDYLTIKVRLTAKNSASIQLGNIKLTYSSKY